MSMAQTPVSQLLERNLALFNGKQLLVAGCFDDNYALELANHADHVTLFTTDFHRHQQWQRLNSPVTTHFGHQFPETEASFDMLLLLLPKAKSEAQYLLANLLPHLQAGADIVLAGENRGGINGAAKLLAPYASRSNKLDSARRCSLVHSQLEQIPAPFCSAEWEQHYPLELDGQPLTIVALPGVFSADGLDEGTRMLLEHLPPLSGRVVDMGCGAGVIGTALCQKYPDLQVEMCDINALALESARRTLQANGLSAQVYPSDMLGQIAEGVSHIVTNPPFHTGLNTHYAATEQMILDAPQKLVKGGSLLLVANAFLKYRPFIEQAFGGCKVLAEDKKFKLYHTV